MITCYHCRRMLDSERLASLGRCPYCESDLYDSNGPTWTSVARVASLAEVGYFEDLLAAAGIETAIHEREDFDAVSGIWNRSYVVQTSAEQAEEAVRLIQQELDATDAEDRSELPGEYDPSSSLRRSMALVLVAGGLAYWGGKGAMEAVREPARAQPVAAQQAGALWRALSESEQPLVATQGAAGPQRVLRYDRQRNALYLEEDLNGDGRYDRRRAFRDGELVFEELR